MGLGRGGECADLHVEIFPQVTVLGVGGGPELLLLGRVPHAALPQYGHLGHAAALQLLQRAPAGPQQLPHKVELK